MAGDNNEPAPQSPLLLAAKVLWEPLVGVVVFLVMDRYAPDDLSLSLMTAVFVTGVLFVAQFLYEVVNRMDRVNRTLTRRMDHVNHTMTERMDRFGETMTNHLDSVEVKLQGNIDDLGHGAHLVQLLGKSPLPVDLVDGLVRNSIDIAANHTSLSAGLVRAELVRLSDFMMELRFRQTASYAGEDRDWLLSLARLAQHSIKAISLTTVDAGGDNFVDGGLWRSDLGIRYLNLQQDAIAERGVVVQRIFISSLPEDKTRHLFSEIISPQKHLGIDVRVLNPESIRGPEAALLRDFIIFDDEVVYETTPADLVNPAHPGNTPVALSSRLTVHPQDIADRVSMFNRLWKQGVHPPKVLQQGA